MESSTDSWLLKFSWKIVAHSSSHRLLSNIQICAKWVSKYVEIYRQSLVKLAFWNFTPISFHSKITPQFIFSPSTSPRFLRSKNIRVFLIWKFRKDLRNKNALTWALKADMQQYGYCITLHILLWGRFNKTLFWYYSIHLILLVGSEYLIRRLGSSMV